MLLVHTAMAGSAEKVEREANRLEEGSSLQRFRAAFNEWATALMYLSEREDDLFGDHHSHSATPEDDAEVAMFVANSDEHSEMDEKFQNVMDVLNVEIGRTSVIRRTRQHLEAKFMAVGA